MHVSSDQIHHLGKLINEQDGAETESKVERDRARQQQSYEGLHGETYVSLADAHHPALWSARIGSRPNQRG